MFSSHSILKKYFDVLADMEYMKKNGDELIKNLKREMKEGDEDGNAAKEKQIEKIIFLREMTEVAEGSAGVQSMLGKNLEFDAAISLITRDDDD